LEGKKTQGFEKRLSNLISKQFILINKEKSPNKNINKNTLNKKNTFVKKETKNKINFNNSINKNIIIKLNTEDILKEKTINTKESKESKKSKESNEKQNFFITKDQLMDNDEQEVEDNNEGGGGGIRKSMLPITIMIKKNLDKFINDNHDNKDRRQAVSLEEKEVKLFMDALKSKIDAEKNQKYSLIPTINNENFLKKDKSLSRIYSKCSNNVKYSEEIDKVLNKVNNKKLTNSVKEKEKMLEKMRRELDNFIINKEERIFLYDKNGNGRFVDKDMKDGIKNIDLISKISDKLAYLQRHRFMDQYGYNYMKDQDFIFKEEVNQLNKKKLKIDLFKEHTKKLQQKFDKVNHLLDEGMKGHDILQNKVDGEFIKLYEHRMAKRDIMNEDYSINYNLGNSKSNNNIFENKITKIKENKKNKHIKTKSMGDLPDITSHYR
jgi:hypothetical protein